MTLTPDDWNRLEFLLGKDHVVGINSVELDEIIELIKTEYQDERDEREWHFTTRKQWVDFGSVMVGARLMIRQARLIHPPDTFLHPEKVYADIYAESKKEQP